MQADRGYDPKGGELNKMPARWPAWLPGEEDVPSLNASSITSRVEMVTLNVEFCWG